MEMRKKKEKKMRAIYLGHVLRLEEDKIVRSNMKLAQEEETWYTKREMVEDQQGRNEKDDIHLKHGKQENKWQELASAETVTCIEMHNKD